MRTWKQLQGRHSTAFNILFLFGFVASVYVIALLRSRHPPPVVPEPLPSPRLVSGARAPASGGSTSIAKTAPFPSFCPFQDASLDWMPPGMACLLAEPQQPEPTYANPKDRVPTLVPSSSGSRLCSLVRTAALHVAFPSLFDLDVPGCMKASGSHATWTHGLNDTSFHRVFRDFTHQYKTCAVVGASSILGERPRGNDIDDHDAVFRINYAPVGTVPGFENLFNATAVGRYTTVQLIGRSWHLELFDNPHEDNIIAELFGRLQERSADPSLVYHGRNFIQSSKPSLVIYKDAAHLDDEFLARVFEAMPHSAFMLLSRDVGRSLWHVVHSIFGEELGVSTGFLTALFALRHCVSVDVYGFYPFCRSPAGTKLRYNYYTEVPTEDACIEDGTYMDRFHLLSREFLALADLHRKGWIRLII